MDASRTIVRRLRDRIERTRRDEHGAALLEFTIVATLLFTMLFGIVEFGLAFRDRLTISNATQGAARVGSALGDDEASDFAVLKSLEQSLATLPNSGIDIVQYVDIYLAGVDGRPEGNCASGDRCNRYFWTPGAFPTCDWTPCPDPSSGSPSYGGGWTPGTRDVQLPGLDVMGVEVTFAHTWVTGGLVPLPDASCTAPDASNCWHDTALMRLEPQQFEL